ncbi:hypothetical protein [Desulfovibrio aminophilus]|uniref:hypothetical protein n=1 Tax=Desulfovibrio aminophilus TaxID=81425 RepID=UPI000425A85F|nr:hypothetical protein [Desulfovibrio aminophilus]
MKQLSLFDDDGMSQLAGLIPSVRAAMNRAAGADEEGRKLLLDRINAVAVSAGVRLTAGNVKAISKDTLDKWLSPGDRDHTPSLLAVVVFCLATKNYDPLRMLLRVVGLDVLTAEDRKLRDYGRACVSEREARRKKKQLEESI